MDLILFHFIHDHRHPLANRISAFLSGITAYGALWIGIALVFIVTSKLGWVIAATMTLAMLIMLVITYAIIPRFIIRPRPFFTLPHVETIGKTWVANSLPSGHTASTVAMLTVLVYHFPVVLPEAILFGLALMWSRIYNGMHWPSDTLAGLAVGLAAGWAGIYCITHYFDQFFH